jgi:hypothetical protein
MRTTPGTAVRVVRVVVGGLLGVVLAASCGGSGAAPSPPAALQAALGQVDAAVAGHDPARARLALDVLVARTLAARDQGLISAEQADRVLAAASTLRVALPLPAPTATAVPSSSASREGDGADDGEKGRGKGRGKEHDD